MSLNEEYTKYTYRVLSLCLIIFVAIMSANWLIDPYGVWLDPRIQGFNNYMILSGHERLHKMIQVSKRERIEVLFLGSSTVYYALNPETMFHLTGKVSYNAGIPSAHLAEMKELLQQSILFHPELEEVILGLNWFMFFPSNRGMEKGFPKGQVGFNFPVGQRAATILFSADALQDSISTIKGSIRGRDNVMDFDGKLNSSVLKAAHRHVRNFKMFSQDTTGNLRFFRKHIAFDAPMMEEYKSIVAICKENNIKLRVYINPVHASFVEGIYACGADTYFEDWKRRLATIYPVWDFSRHSFVTDEPFSLSRKYWRNSQHPMLPTGDLILKKLTGSSFPEEENEFGVLLTEKNVGAVLQKEHNIHLTWEKDNPEIVKRVKEIVDNH